MQLWMAIAFCAAGSALAVAGLLPFLRRLATRRWRRTTGTVVSCDVTWSDGVGLAGDAVEIVRMGALSVAYDYAVDGTTHRGTRVGLSDPKRRHAKECEALAARLAPGAKVDVFHNPRDPARAVLDRSAGWIGFVFVPLGLLTLAAGVALLVL